MAYLKMTIVDTMSFYDDYLGDYTFNPSQSSTFTSWYRLPDDWLTKNGTLTEERREAVFCHLYGETWRMGNGDGSKNIVLNCSQQQLSDAEAAARPWESAKETYYLVKEDGSINRAEHGEI